MSVSLPIPAISSPIQQRTRWLLVAMHVPFFAFTIGQAGLGLTLPPPYPYQPQALTLAIVAAALQLHHSFAAAAGLRPRYWRWTLTLLVAIAWLPIPFLTSRWATLQWFALASFAMLLPGRLALWTSIASALVYGVFYTSWEGPSIVAPGYTVWVFSYFCALQFLGAVGLYGATRFIRLMEELSAAHADLAELAIERERLRISRDLHDLLGQSLSAVSLKGDLAVGLLERNDTPRATAEIESIVHVARSALHDLLDIAHHEPPIALEAEIERANDLLAATGTETQWQVRVDALSPPVDELFAWALREGITNVLRHSTATTCAITIARHDSGVRLDILNDGAMPASVASGHGLSGLAARASALSGVAIGHALGDGRYRLRVEVPA
jgi:two-component system, NarL family, sensor histidine kinase DesK